MEVFNITGLKELRTQVEKDPQLIKKLKKDFEGTLKERGIVVDETFRKEVERQRKERMSNRIKARMSKLPKSKKKYYSMIAAGKPIRVTVKIDRKKGKTTITPRGNVK